MTKINQTSAKIGGGLALALLSLANLAPAQATTFTFDGGDDGLATITKTVDDITITVSNPSPDSVFNTDSDGLPVLSLGDFVGLGDISSFEISFDKPVQLISYFPDFVLGEGDESITLSAGAFSSVETNFVTNVETNFANQFTVQAGQVISVLADFGTLPEDGIDLVQWSSITVNEVEPVSTPEPASLVALLGFGALGLATRRKSK
ncbi:MAG: PEP-CTERM sorting domain-containing protein [Crocosphaera sp.]